MTRQEAILAWAIEMFGDAAGTQEERAMRFVEEAIELGHALGLSRGKLQIISDRVYSRDGGDVPKELGQAQMTLEALAESLKLDAFAECDVEFNRVRSISKEDHRRRHAAKVAMGMGS